MNKLVVVVFEVPASVVAVTVVVGDFVIGDDDEGEGEVVEVVVDSNSARI